ncbi:MAG: type II toxin-antitoxin system prevent-host-death family antitoxin [Armatimonadetes bacterium]|nr:type II toxin-antitoxin system prevent-host-death family antitoxin [Armatimonadota bacterium]
MITVTVQDVQADFESVLNRVLRGEDVVISREGVLVARVTRVSAARQRVPGTAKGRVVLAPDFDAPLPDDILDSFER